MINGIFILDNCTDLILQKQLLCTQYKWDINWFTRQLKKSCDNLPLNILHENIYYFHIKRDDVFFIAVSDNGDMSSYTVLEYLEKLTTLLRDFLGPLSSEVLVKNIGLVIEILNESTSAGSPKLSDTTKLKPLMYDAVKQHKHDNEGLLSYIPDNLFGISKETEERMTKGESSKKPLESRAANLKNEVFVDLIEILNVVVDSTGCLLFCHIEGKLDVKSYLNKDVAMTIMFPSQPENQNIVKNSVFNQVVSTKELPSCIKATVSPGHLRCLAYSVEQLGGNLSLPFTLFSNINPCKQDKLLTLHMQLHCSLPIRNPAVKLTGKIGLPTAVLSVSGISSLLNVSFEHNKQSNEYVFLSPIFPGESEHTITIKIVVSEWTPAIVFEISKLVLQFEVPMLCMSDMRISGLKINETSSSNPHLKVNKWVRYITYSSSYEFYFKEDWL